MLSSFSRGLRRSSSVRKGCFSSSILRKSYFSSSVFGNTKWDEDRTMEFFPTRHNSEMFLKLSKENPDARMLKFVLFGENHVFPNDQETQKIFVQSELKGFSGPFWNSTPRKIIGEQALSVIQSLEKHSLYRKVVTPLFGESEMYRQLSVIQKQVEDSLKVLCEQSKDGNFVKVYPIALDIAFYVSIDMVLGEELQQVADKVRIQKLFEITYLQGLLSVEEEPTPGGLLWCAFKAKEDLYSSLTELTEVATELLDKNGFEPYKKIYFFSLLRKYQSGEINQEEFYDNILAIWVASFETTATSLVNTIELLYNDFTKGALVKLEEVLNDTNFMIPDSPIDEQELRDCEYLDFFVKEMLRMRPAGEHWATPRILNKDMEVHGETIPKGTVIHNPVSLSHFRNTQWRDDCYEFKPERFDMNAKKLDYGYNTFGSGNRICPGRYLAYLELKVTIILLLRQWNVIIDEESRAWDYESFLLRPALKIRLEEQKDKLKEN